MIYFVHRNDDNAITYAGILQAGYSEEQLDDDTSAELAAFLHPAPIPVQPSPREWLERLSTDKQAAISTAAIGNGTILLWLLKAAGTPAIDVTSAETIAGVGALVAAGILTQDDQAVLLAP